MNRVVGCSWAVSGLILVALTVGCESTPLCGNKCAGDERPDRPSARDAGNEPPDPPSERDAGNERPDRPSERDAGNEPPDPPSESEVLRFGGALPDDTLPMQAKPHGGPDVSGVRPRAPYPGYDVGALAAHRALLEADLVQLEGDRVFAVSAESHFSIVDVSDPMHPKLREDRALVEPPQSGGTPFALYVRGSSVLVIVNRVHTPFETSVGSSSTWIYALDMSSNPAVIAERKISGDVVESRLCGDALCVVSIESDSRPDSYPVAAIRTFATDTLKTRDELRVTGVTLPRQLPKTLFGKYVYIANARDWFDVTDPGRWIQIVDVSNPDDLVEGAIRVRDPLDYGWQMHEHEDTLRVVSQREGEAPVLQTMSIKSVYDIAQLGELRFDSGTDEWLRSVRFDGTRAYAKLDGGQPRVLTFDLSNPSLPRQASSIAPAGSLYHVEPRGEQLLTLEHSSDGEPTLSLNAYDVTDLAQPARSSRVEFAGGWPLDLEAYGLHFPPSEGGPIVVPFMRVDPRSDRECAAYDAGGLQVVELDGKTLHLGPTFELDPSPRRVFVHRDYVLAASGGDVEAFSLLDPPERTTSARHVSRVALLEGGAVARVSSGESFSRQLELVRDAGSVNLRPPFARDENGCLPLDLYDVYAVGTRLFALYDGGAYLSELVAFETGDPGTRKIVGQTSWAHGNWVRSGDVLARNGAAPMLAWIERLPSDPAAMQVRIVDLRDPSAIDVQVISLIGKGPYLSLVASDEALFVSRYEKVGSDRARFYVERIDLSEPGGPLAREPVEIPGALVYVDAASGSALARGWKNTEHGPVATFSVIRFEGSRAVVEDSLELDPGWSVRATATGERRVFAALENTLEPSSPVRVLVLSGFDFGMLRSAALEAGSDPISGIYAAGERAVLVAGKRYAALDASDASSPRVSDLEELPEIPLDVDVRGGRAVFALGPAGTLTVDL